MLLGIPSFFQENSVGAERKTCSYHFLILLLLLGPPLQTKERLQTGGGGGDDDGKKEEHYMRHVRIPDNLSGSLPRCNQNSAKSENNHVVAGESEREGGSEWRKQWWNALYICGL